MSLAFLIGIPLGSFVGAEYGWPACFWLAAGLAAVAAVATATGIPKIGVLPSPPEGAFQRATRPPATSLLTVTFMSFFATFTSVAFIGPLVTALTGLTGGDIGYVQLFVGIGSLFGLVLGARLATSHGLKALTPLMTLVAVTQFLFTAGMLGDLPPVTGTILTCATVAVGAGTLFALAPIVQSALAEIAGPAATIAFALNGSVVFLGQGVGTVVGGGVIAQTSLTWTGLVGAAIAVVTLGITQRLRDLRVSVEAKAPAA